METALKLFGEIEGKRLNRQNERNTFDDKEDSSFNLNLSDQFSVYIELIAVLRILGMTAEANVRMEEAAVRFKVRPRLPTGMVGML